MTRGVARGTFEVTLKPLGGADDPIGSMSIEKIFVGELEGTSVGQMLAVRTMHPGSAGYVAMERLTVTLAGRDGSFALQHTGTMERGVPQASVTVIPDSATDALSGLAGTMSIDIAGSKHTYIFDYSLPDQNAMS